MHQYLAIGIFSVSLVACGGGEAGSEGAYLPPSVNAGIDLEAPEQSEIILDAIVISGSAAISSLQWQQVAGDSVNITDANSLAATANLPVAKIASVLSFEFSVTDATGNTVSDTVDITVLPVNNAPVVNAGVDFSAAEQSTVELSAAVTDQDGTITSYQWQQTSGTPVTLLNSDGISPSFLAPAVIDNTDLEFSLTVIDDEDGTASDSVKVSITPIPELVITFPGGGRFSGSAIDVAGRVDAYNGDYSQITVTAATALTSAHTTVNNEGRWRISDFSLGDTAGKQVITVTASDQTGFSSEQQVKLEVGSDFTVETDVVDIIESRGYLRGMTFDASTEKLYMISDIGQNGNPKLTKIDPVTGEHTITPIDNPGSPWEFTVDKNNQKLLMFTGWKYYGIDEYDLNSGENTTLATSISNRDRPVAKSVCLFENSRLLFIATRSEIIKVDLNTSESTIISDENNGSGDLLTQIQSATCDESSNTIIVLDEETRNGAIESIYDINAQSGDRTLRRAFFNTVPLINPDAIAFSSKDNSIILTAQGTGRTIQKLDVSNTLITMASPDVGEGAEIDYSPKIALDDKNQRVFFEGDSERLLMADIESGDRVVIYW